jgi:serine/threonine protein kinase
MSNPRVHRLPADHNKFPRRLGPYVVVTFLGEGGMGSVYLALTGCKDAAKFCVIKQLGSAWSDFPADELPAIEGRFKREAEITMALSHPSIPKTFAVGDEQGPYLVQEFVDGVNLRHLVAHATSAGESISVPLASYIVVEVAKALSYLHDFESLGLVHRDVTPDNVMLAASGEVKLIDFGIAKATARDDGLTTRGVVGKAEWMAPEIFHGAKLDRRADIYALGLLYWYLLTRRDPGSTQSNRTATQDRFLPPSAFVADVTPELDRVVTRAMDPNPEFRFQTAKELQRAATRLVPAGLKGKEEVAGLIFRNTSRLGDGLYPRLMEEGRPLLDDAPAAERDERRRVVNSDATEIARPVRWRRMVLFALGVVGVLVAGLVIPWKGEKTAEKTPVQAPPVPAVVAPPVPLPEPEGKPAPATESRPPAPAPGVASAAVPVRKTAAPQPKVEPERGVVQESADELLARAVDRFEASEIPTALGLARLAASRGAGAQAYVLIGRILAIKHDLPGAETAFEQALHLSPDNFEAARRLERLRRKTPDDSP